MLAAAAFGRLAEAFVTQFMDNKPNSKDLSVYEAFKKMCGKAPKLGEASEVHVVHSSSNLIGAVWYP
jgi:hypothetical protein